MLRLTTLGALDLRDDRGHPVRDVLRQPKRLALLVYLTLETQRAPVSREKLLALFWPESDTERARNALSQLLHQLRVALGRELFEAQGPTAISLARSALWCDAVAFEELVTRAELDVAVDLYHGEFCPALNASASPELDQWLEARRAHLRTRAITAMTALAKDLARRGERDGAARAARRALAEQPDDEGEVRSLLSLLDSLADGAGALTAYRGYARRLEAELGAHPDAATQRLVETIRSRRATPTAPLAPVVSLAHAASLASAPDASPPEPARQTRLRGPRRWMGRSVLGIVAGLIAVSVAFAFRGRDPAVDRARRTIAVFPFTVRGDSSLSYLRRGMVDLLSAKLDGANGFNAIDPRSAIGALGNRPDTAPATAEQYRRVALQLGAGRYLVGDLVGVGKQVQLSAALHDASRGAVVASASVVGSADSLLAMVDALTGRLLSRLAVARDTGLTQLAAVTTPSLPALLAFLAGEEALRAGHDAQAVAAFRDATALDTSFALAFYRLAVSATWVSLPDLVDPKVPAEAALRHSRRLTPLARDLLGAYVAYRSLRADEAEHAYLTVATGRPDNVEAWYMLAETRFHYNFFRGRTSRESIAAFRRVLALDPGNPHVLIHLARIAALDGDVVALDSLVTSYLAIHADAQRALEMRALVAFVRGDSANRAAIIEGARDADDVVWSSLLQGVLMTAQNFGAAVELAPHFAANVESPYVRVLGGRALTDLALARGQLSARAPAALSGALFDRDWSLESQAFVAANPWFKLPRAMISAIRDSISARHSPPALVQTHESASAAYAAVMQKYLLGALSVRLGDTLTASRMVGKLVDLSRRDAALALVDTELASALRADLARARGDRRGALAELERFRALAIPGTVFGLARWGTRERFARAELLLELGRFDEALEVYGSFESQYDLLYMAPSHLRRAEIHERLGNRERAIFHYSRFVDMWSDADPELQPIVQAARAELARLRLAR